MSKVRNYALTAKYASLILPTWSCSRMQIMRTWQFLKKVHIECNQSTFFMSLYQAICFLVSHFIYRSAWHISPSASDKTLSHIQKIRTGNINENWKLPPHLKTWLEEHSRTVTLPMRPFRRYEKNNWQLEGRNSKSQVQSLSSPNDKYHNLPATQKREWWDSKHLLA